jgi:hypothetical protein
LQCGTIVMEISAIPDSANTTFSNSGSRRFGGRGVLARQEGTKARHYGTS